jgi:hypothetical protein
VRFYCYDVGEALTVYLSWTQMLQLPSVIAMSIAATRIYRNLADYANGSTDMCFFLRFLYLLRSLSSMIRRSFGSLQIRDGKNTKTEWKPSAPTPISQIEVNVDIRCEQHSTAQSIISVDEQLGDKPHRSSLDSDLEKAMENTVPR